ncbi:expressed unknown protein [Seminavis robusta]|uniref:Uncharacterized protein n=1 Tax=Seminavis robusta TaxID=568900 RepID=A0A9N8DI76_9STRA|nr:expressed unknown protein [Seminavis robusta]|eukprot:Sro172_g075850.1 n/a (175) ;mRNA; f:310-834
MGNHNSTLPMNIKNVPPKVLAMLADEKHRSKLLADVQSSFTANSDSGNPGVDSTAELDYIMQGLVKASKKDKTNKSKKIGIKRTKAHSESGSTAKACPSQHTATDNKPSPKKEDANMRSSNHSLEPQEIVNLLEQFATKDCNTGMAFLRALQAHQPTTKYHNGNNADIKAPKAA